MQIDISHVIGRLETACNQAERLEVSGYGFIRQEGDTLVVYDACVLDVGSWGETNIDPKDPEVAEKLLDLLEREDAANLKLWWHRHPILGWSSTDEYACRVTPMGGDPKHVRWSAAVVRTPHGWIGRIDNHLTDKTAHVPVVTGAEDVVADTDGLRVKKSSAGATIAHANYTLFNEDDDIEDLDYEDLAEELDEELDRFGDGADQHEYDWKAWLRKKVGMR